MRGPCSPAQGTLGARPSVTAPSSRSGHLSSSAPSTSRVPEHTASLKCVRVSHGWSHTALGVHSVLCLCFARCHASCELNSASLLHSTPHVPVAEVHHGGPLGCSWAHAQDPGRGSAPAWPAGRGVPERGWRGGSKLRVAWAPGVQSLRLRPSGVRARRALPVACGPSSPSGPAHAPRVFWSHALCPLCVAGTFTYARSLHGAFRTSVLT